VLPVWRLSVSLDASQLPAQKAGWRSLFYSVFAVVSVPLVFLAGLFVVSRVRQEVNAAKHKVDFLANVTHELKTPLTSIRMFAETLQMGRSRSEEETRESLAIIGREAERLSRMIERVLEYSRLEQQTKVFNFRPVDLSDVADDAVTLFRAQAAKTAGTRILLDTEPGIPDIIGDRDAIKDVLLNLLSNAVKYGGAGKEINVNLRSDGRWVALEVVDRGQGIPPDEQSKVFDKFYRSNDVLARKVEGTGLGLSICREIAKAHGGTISVKSSVGEGSTFTLRLPVSGGSSGRRTAVRM
jgi:two-component system phosphate regulon sensor histidine kinase PhoR